MDRTSEIELRSASRMPVMGLGTWQLRDDTVQAVETALQLGYRLIDTSGDYGTQQGIGEGIRRSGLERADIFLVTKVEETDNAYEATRKNLDELQLDHADLVLIHRPPRTGSGESLWRGLLQAKNEGLATDIGVSNYTIELIDELTNATGEAPVVNQIEWSPFGHSEAMLREATRRGIAIQAYSPLTRSRRLDDDTLSHIATRYGKTPAQLVIRWNLQRGTIPLPKANQASHMEENLDVFDFAIDETDMRQLNMLNQHYSSLGTLAYL
jgi:2,5-diketo-D-gluconate reductase A